MKELSIEEKAQRFDEAINTIRNLVKAGLIYEDAAIQVFHELKENEDERTWIINYLNNRILNSTIIAEKENLKKAIAWLENQGEQKKSHDTCDSSMMDNKKSPYGEKRDFGYFEENPTDKVEPKFKVGDWITNGATNPTQISSIKDGMYFTHNDTIGGDVESIDKEYHLWTIQDAKDGDVLAYKNDIVIFKENSYNPNDKSGCMFVYCSCNNFYEIGGINPTVYKPATKEQRDLLFQKMKEAGYEWDAEKKELKKIEQTQVIVIDCSDTIKDNWELIHEFVTKFGRIPKDEDELNVLIEYVLKRQKFAWSEEDENQLAAAINIVANSGHTCTSDWLKALKERVQLQNGYNPYKEVVESIAEMCKHYDTASHSGLRDFYDNVRVKCKDAKEYDSLYPQNTWKPSDEQIACLQDAVTRYVREGFIAATLTSLLEQLKKLREE